jgi:hypothetical protein
MKTLLFFTLCEALASLCVAELDIEVVILDDTNFNATKFINDLAEFNPIRIINGTSHQLIFSPPVARITGFVNPILCVGTDCYSEANATEKAPSPIATPGPAAGVDTVAIASAVSCVIAVLLGLLCYCLVRRRRAKAVKLDYQLQRVIIRETIDLPPHLAARIHGIKTGSKHMRGAV